MKTSIANTSGLFKVALLSTILGLSVLTSACSDDKPADDNKTEQTDDQAKQDDSSAAKSDKADKETKPAVPVEVTAVTRGNIQQTYHTITTLEAEKDAQVVARSTGILQKIHVEEGDYVNKGDLLAQLDVAQLSLEVAQLEATSNKLNKELERQQTLFNRKLGTNDALDRARFEFQSQQAQFQLSKLKLQYASIKAPISGVITERLVKTGNLIRENDTLFKIIDPVSLKAVLHLPEKELNQVIKGQNILLSVDAFKDKVIAGKIERIRPMIDSDTGTFKVVANIDNSANLLRAGMFGKVEVVFDVHQDSLLLEQQAIITQDNRSHVFVVKDNKAIQTPISLGFRQNGLVEIVSGLSDKDQVITTGQQILKHETLVEIVGQPEEIAKSESTNAASNIALHP